LLTSTVVLDDNTKGVKNIMKNNLMKKSLKIKIKEKYKRKKYDQKIVSFSYI